MKIGEKLRILRKARKMTGQELGKASGTGQSTISEIENGIRSPTLETLEKIAVVLDVSIVELILDSTAKTVESHRVLYLFDQLSKTQQDAIIRLLESMVVTPHG